MQIEKRDFSDLVVRPNERTNRIADWNAYRDCVKALNNAGRCHVDEVLKKYGYARVVQALAARILKSACEFETYDVNLARQIPMPAVNDLGNYVEFHPAFIMAEFRRIVRFHLAD